MPTGWIMLSSQTSTEPVPFEDKRVILDEDMAKFAEYAAFKFFPSGVLVPGDSVADPPVPDTYRAPTAAEVFAAVAADTFTKWKNEADAWHYAKIKAQVEPAIEAQFQPINLIPAP